MGLPAGLAAASLALAGATAVWGAAPPAVAVKDAVARVTVIPENRADIKVEVLSANPKLPLRVGTVMGRTTIDGRLGSRIRDCQGRAEQAVIRVRGLGDVRWSDAPLVVIRTPRDVNIDVGGAVWGAIGRSASVKLGTATCGDWTVANVEGPLVLSQAGSGDTRTGQAAQAKFRVAGDGDVYAADIRGGLQVDVAGAGDVAVSSVQGPLAVHVAGPGDVRVRGGRATRMNVAVMGSGNVDFGGSADSLKVSIAGSGDVYAREVRGRISRSVVGSGRVRVGTPNSPPARGRNGPAALDARESLR